MIAMLPWLLGAFPILALAWDTQCYAPNGDKVHSKFAPCIAVEGEFSMCCRINDTNPDVCLKNGLCHLKSDTKEQYFRNYCSDQSWNSPNCLKNVCVQDEDGSSSKPSKQVYLCQGEKWCCGSSNACCTDDKTFTLKNTLVNIGGNSTATTTATVTATATGAANGGETSSSSSSSSSSSNVVIGVGVAVPLGVLAFAMLGAGFWWGRRNMAARYEALRNDYQANGMPATFITARSKQVQEAEANPVRLQVELPTGDEETRPRY